MSTELAAAARDDSGDIVGTIHLPYDHEWPRVVRDQYGSTWVRSDERPFTYRRERCTDVYFRVSP